MSNIALCSAIADKPYIFCYKKKNEIFTKYINMVETQGSRSETTRPINHGDELFKRDFK